MDLPIRVVRRATAKGLQVVLDEPPFLIVWLPRRQVRWGENIRQGERDIILEVSDWVVENMAKQQEVHGKARLSPCGKYLTITTQRKRGKKVEDYVCTYFVQDCCPDHAVANPAYSLAKGELVVGEDGAATFTFSPGGEVWHVHVGAYGTDCSCPAKTFGQPACKHVRAAKAVGLLEKKVDA